MIVLILVIMLFTFIYLCFLVSKNKTETFTNSLLLREDDANINTNKLNIKKTNNYRIVFENDQFSVWDAINIDDYTSTNQYITAKNKTPSVLGILVKSRSDGLDKPKGYRLISTIDDIKIWKMIPNDGYVAMGHIFSKEEPQLHQYRCIDQKYVLQDTIKSIEYSIDNYNIWSGSISNSFLYLTSPLNNINDSLYKYKYDTFDVEKLKLKNINSFIKIAELYDIAFWKPDTITDYCSIGQIAYPVGKNPNTDGLSMSIVHKKFCKPLYNYKQKILSFVYQDNVFSVWRPKCYSGYGVMSDVVTIGSDAPVDDRDVFSVSLDTFKNINYSRTMDWTSMNSRLNDMFSIWCNSNKYFHLTNGLDKPFTFDIEIDSNYTINDYDIMDKTRDISLTFNKEKSFAKYDENEIIDLIKNNLSNRLIIRENRLQDLVIEDDKINMKVSPKLKNIGEATSKDICDNIKSLIDTVSIKIYTNNRLNCLLTINQMEEYYVPENIIYLDNSEAIASLSV